MYNLKNALDIYFYLTLISLVSLSNEDCTNQGIWTAWTPCSVTYGEGITSRACLHFRRTPSNEWNFTALFLQNQTCTKDLCYVEAMPTNKTTLSHYSDGRQSDTENHMKDSSERPHSTRSEICNTSVAIVKGDESEPIQTSTIIILSICLSLVVVLSVVVGCSVRHRKTCQDIACLNCLHYKSKQTNYTLNKASRDKVNREVNAADSTYTDECSPDLSSSKRRQNSLYTISCMQDDTVYDTTCRGPLQQNVINFHCDYDHIPGSQFQVLNDDYTSLGDPNESLKTRSAIANRQKEPSDYDILCLKKDQDLEKDQGHIQNEDSDYDYVENDMKTHSL